MLMSCAIEENWFLQLIAARKQKELYTAVLKGKLYM